MELELYKIKTFYLKLNANFKLYHLTGIYFA